MGKKGYYIGSGVLIGVGALLVILGLVFQLAIFPAIVKHTVKKNMVIGLKKDGETLNEFADDWINSKYEILMQYYIWNYTNDIEMVDRGMKPDAYDVGPYSYKQVNEYIYDNSSWLNDSYYFEYILQSTYYFDPDTSCEGCDPDKDMVRVPDLLFFVFMDMLYPFVDALDRNETTRPILGLLSIPIFGYKIDPIITVSVSDLLFNGYEPPLVHALKEIAYFLVTGTHGILDPDTEGVIQLIIEALEKLRVPLNDNNGTIDSTYWYTINTGKSNYNDVGKVISMRKTRDEEPMSTVPLEWWNGTECAEKELAIEFRGTNGDYFSPFLKKTDKLSAYVEDICRSINFRFLQESNVKGVDTYQYTLDTDSFNYSFAENCGYCQTEVHDIFNFQSTSKSDQCLPTGILDLVGCKSQNFVIFKIPVHVVVSLPHFFGADDAVLKWFPRMRPNADEHLTTLDIEPTVGSVLRANKRLQINVAGGSYAHTVFKNLPNGAFPIVWLNNSYLADDKTIKDVKDDLINPRKIVKYVCYIAGVGFGSLLVLIGVTALILRNIHEKSKSPTEIIGEIASRNPDPGNNYRPNGEFDNSTLTRRKPQNWE